MFKFRKGQTIQFDYIPPTPKVRRGKIVKVSRNTITVQHGKNIFRAYVRDNIVNVGRVYRKVPQS